MTTDMPDLEIPAEVLAAVPEYEEGQVAVVIVDFQGVVLGMNKPAEELFKMESADIAGEFVEMLVPTKKRWGHQAYRRGYLVEPRDREMDPGLYPEAETAEGDIVPIRAGSSPSRWAASSSWPPTWPATTPPPATDRSAPRRPPRSGLDAFRAGRRASAAGVPGNPGTLPVVAACNDSGRAAGGSTRRRRGRKPMTELNQTLPLLPLTSGVVLPGMVFTMALETDEAKAAADAAGSVGGELVLVPHIDGRYASVGVIAKILETGRAARRPRGHGGERAAPGHHRHRRARHRAGAVGPGRAGREATAETPERSGAGPRVPRRAREHPPDPRGAPHGRAPARRHRGLADRRSVGLLARPEPGPEGRGARDHRPRGAPAPRARLGARDPRRPDAARADQDQRRGGHGEDAARVPAAPPARGHPQGAERARRQPPTKARSTTTAPRWKGATCPRPCARAVLREVDKLERTSEQSPEHGWIRTWLDTILELPWGVQSEDNLDVEAAAAGSSTRTTTG